MVCEDSIMMQPLIPVTNTSLTSAANPARWPRIPFNAEMWQSLLRSMSRHKAVDPRRRPAHAMPESRQRARRRWHAEKLLKHGTSAAEYPKNQLGHRNRKSEHKEGKC